MTPSAPASNISLTRAFAAAAPARVVAGVLHGQSRQHRPGYAEAAQLIAAYLRERADAEAHLETLA